jgi:catechol 2,3-dioxygenase-like lactoylglutathione lyase family enzyme
LPVAGRRSPVAGVTVVSSRHFDLDHVALAVHDVAPAMDELIGHLGGTLLSGGDAAGFRAMQIRMGDLTKGMTVELLEPWNLERSDFLVRFLDRRGEGPHHLTFKVPDLAAELERLADLGLRPVGVDLSNPMWREAFLSPRDSHGTVIQIAESAVWRFELAWESARSGEPVGRRWWPEPPPRGGAPAVLERVVMESRDVQHTAGFFMEVLGAELRTHGSDLVELTWPGGGRIRIEEGPEEGIDRLEVTGAGNIDRTIAGVRVVSSQ